MPERRITLTHECPVCRTYSPVCRCWDTPTERTATNGPHLPHDLDLDQQEESP